MLGFKFAIVEIRRHEEFAFRSKFRLGSSLVVISTWFDSLIIAEYQTVRLPIYLLCILRFITEHYLVIEGLRNGIVWIVFRRNVIGKKNTFEIPVGNVMLEENHVIRYLKRNRYICD